MGRLLLSFFSPIAFKCSTLMSSCRGFSNSLAIHCGVLEAGGNLGSCLKASGDIKLKAFRRREICIVSPEGSLATAFAPILTTDDWYFGSPLLPQLGEKFFAGLHNTESPHLSGKSSRCSAVCSAGMSHEERPNFYRQEVNKTIWEVPERYQNLSPVGSGAYGSVWWVTFNFVVLAACTKTSHPSWPPFI